MDKQIKIKALDILIEAVQSHQKQSDFDEFILKLCTSLDETYNTIEFHGYYAEKAHFYSDLLISDDEALFIQSNHTPYLIKQKIIVSNLEKLRVYLTILEWLKNFDINNLSFIINLAKHFQLDNSSSERLIDFIFRSDDLIHDKNFLKLLPLKQSDEDQLEGDWVDLNKPTETKNKNSFCIPKVQEELGVYFWAEEKVFLINKLNSTKNSSLNQETICAVAINESIPLSKGSDLTYSDLKQLHIANSTHSNFGLSVQNLCYSFKNGNGIKSVNILAKPGQLIGVIGDDGAGKSTLLKLLIGKLKADSGDAFFNAYSIQKYKYQLSHLIAYIPEEDLVIKELTAYENLDYAIRLSYSKLSNKKKQDLINKTLNELKISSIAHKKIGSAEEKKIHPYQRRLLNIAIEIIRDPYILIVDNSKQGLSRNDASKVIDILTDFSLNGKLVITTITETNSAIFSNFDSLVILDKHGTCRFSGTKDAIRTELINELPDGYCQDLKLDEENSSELISELLEVLNTETQITGKVENTKQQQAIKEQEEIRNRKSLPRQYAKLPRLEQQYISYTLRNFRAKLSRRIELSYTLSAAPIVAFIISIFMRQSPGNEYNFGLNENIPVYFYISILINIFLGLTQSANELIAERRILRREERINLSFFSYINAKASYLLIIILIQTFLYTSIGNIILEIKGVFLFHWAVYFSCGAAGVMLGLIFSSLQKSHNSILLKSIPTTLLVLILLGGGIIPLENFTNKNNKYTPLLSDLVINRWAYEAIIVKQFTHNPYEKLFFDLNKEISISAYNKYQLLPYLTETVQEIQYSPKANSDSMHSVYSAIQFELKYLEAHHNIFPFEHIDSLNLNPNSETLLELEEYLNYLEYYFQNKYLLALTSKENRIDSLLSSNKINYLKELEIKNQNLAIKQMVLNTKSRKSIDFIDRDIVQLTDQAYNVAKNNFGRAKMFTGQKQFNSQIIDTYLFNLSVIWIINIFVYVLLITNIPYEVYKHLRKHLTV